MSTRAQLRTQIRNDLHVWPDTDALQATITSTDTTLTIADGTRAPAGSVLEIESELMTVRSVNVNQLTVRRGDRGTTAAAHNSGVQVLIHGPNDPTNIDLNGFIDDGIRWLFPTCMREILDETTTTADSTIAYTIPAGIEAVDELYITGGGSPVTKRHLRYWQRIGSKVYLPGSMPGGRTLIFKGWGKFTLPSTDASTLDVGDEREPAVEFYTVACVIKTQEALRTRFTGQSALLEARAGNIPDLLGSSRDWMARASAIRNQHQTIRPTMLRKINRHV